MRKLTITLVILLICGCTHAAAIAQPTLSPVQTIPYRGNWVEVKGTHALISDDGGRIMGFELQDGRWVEVSQITGPSGIGFGQTLDFDPESGTALVGAYADDEFGSFSGSIYEYAIGDPWTLESRFVNPDSISRQLFGSSLRIVGENVFVGTSRNVGICGMVHIMAKLGGSWIETQRISADECDDKLGTWIRYDGEVVVLQGQDFDGVDFFTIPPRVLVDSGDQWTDVSTFPDLEGLAPDESIDSDGNTWVIGAREYAGGDGAAYVLKRVGTTFEMHTRLDPWGGPCRAPDGHVFRCEAGSAVAVGGDFVAVGRPNDSTVRNGAGAVYVFRREMDNWIPAALLTNPNSSSGAWQFPAHPFAMAIHGDYLTVANLFGNQVYLYDLSALRTHSDEVTPPSSAEVVHNYPNPFSVSTEIGFSLRKSGPVRINVYDLLGRKVDVLLDDHRPAGRHRAKWKGSGLPSGMYLYTLEAGDQRFTGVATLLR